LSQVQAPPIEWAALSPLLALLAGICVVLVVGLLRPRWVRVTLVPLLTVATLLATTGLSIWQWGENTEVLEAAMAVDDLTLVITFLVCGAGIATVGLSGRAVAPREAGHGEYYALLLSSVLGMVVLAGAQNLVTLFVGFELLSIPLYVLCATEMRRASSLESGLKYLIVGSVGSATLLYGLAMLFGATGSTDFDAIATAITEENLRGDVLFLTSLALIVAGLAFKASIAPFHQWTPDVYEGAPTPITAFMAVATKAAAFGVFIRLFDVALISAQPEWAPALATLAVITIVVGNVGALGQTSLKRLLAYSSVAQAGYILVGLVVSTQRGVEAAVFYLAVYLLMNLAAFAVVVVRERETGRGDEMSILHGLGARRPELAWPMTIAMLALAGLPGTAGFFGKIFLIDAAVREGWGWLGVAIVVGSALSLAYYLRVVAAVWMRAPEPATAARVAPSGRPVMAGGAEGPRGPDDAPGAGDGDPDPGNVEGGARGGDEQGEPEMASRERGVPDPEDPPAAGEEEVAGQSVGEGGDHGERGEPGAQLGRLPEGTAPPREVVRSRQPEVAAVAVVCAVATVALGIYPQPLFDLASQAGEVLDHLL
jgi:NADH-quinone oxidoreductase subunit N